VLFPGGVLPLRIFEPRYLDMISACMRKEEPFGVALIVEGNEVGAAATTYDVGTLVNIDYFHTRNDGLLGITVRGLERFQITQREVQPNQLTLVQIEMLASEAPKPMPARFENLADMLQSIIEQLGQPYIKLKPAYEDAGWVGARLTELLPIGLPQKQYFLQMEDPIQRLERLDEILRTFEVK
jgi:Lon protease-like protein